MLLFRILFDNQQGISRRIGELSIGLAIERYEEDAVPIPDVSGAEMLKHLIEARGGTLSEVAAGTKIAISTLSEILSKKRRLNAASHLPALAKYFNVDRAVFI